jgi:hypothetical protein
MPQHWNRLLVILVIGLCLWASDFGSAMSSVALADNKDALDQVGKNHGAGGAGLPLIETAVYLC